MYLVEDEGRAMIIIQQGLVTLQTIHPLEDLVGTENTHWRVVKSREVPSPFGSTRSFFWLILLLQQKPVERQQAASMLQSHQPGEAPLQTQFHSIHAGLVR